MDIDKYAQRYKKRISEELKKKKELYFELNKRARSTAKYLGEEFKLDIVYLFGSIVDMDKFRLNSDVDFAVKGLESEDFLMAWGLIEKRLEHSFDLVRLEKANDHLLEIIKWEGEIVYES